MANQLNQIFLALQEQIETHLRTNRLLLAHPGAKGDASEESWRKILEE